MTPSSRSPSAAPAARRRRRRQLLGVALVVLIAIPLLVPTFTLKRAKARILLTLQQELDRQINADSVHLVLWPWPGFELDNVRLGDSPAYGVEALATADDAQATLRLLPLWRGRIEFSSIRLDGANINLVRNAAGRWNIADLLDRAAATGPPLRPTSAPTSLRQPARFPYLELRDSRVNFKFELFKRAFYLQNVAASLALEPHAWRVHLRFQPQRTDLNLSDTGDVTIDGTWQRPQGRVAFRDLPFDLAAHLDNSYLAGSSPLLLGHDAGVHGIVGADLRLLGTGHAFEISGVFTADALRRWDLLPSQLRLRIPVDARYRAGDDTLEVVRLGDAAHFDVQGQVANLLTHPHASLNLSFNQVNTASLVPIARAVDPHLPPGLRAAGTLDGMLHIAAGVGLPLSGQGSINGSGLEISDGDTHLRLTAPTCAWRQTTLRCGESSGTITPPDASAAPIVLRAQADHQGLRLRLSSLRVDAPAIAALARLLGLHDPWPLALSGFADASFALDLPWSGMSGAPVAAPPGWSGAAAWSQAAYRLPALAAPIPLRNLRVSLSPVAGLSAQCVAMLGGDAWNAFLTRPAPMGAGTAPLWHFTVGASRAGAAGLAMAFRPRRGGLFSDFLAAPPTLGAWLAALHAQGTVRIADFNWRGHHAGVRFGVTADGRGWQVTPLTLALAGGRFDGSGEWRDGRLQVRGRAVHLDMGKLLAVGPYAQALTGTGGGDLEFSLPLPPDLSPLQAQGTITVQPGSFPVLTTAEGVLRFARFTADVSWRDGTLGFSHATVQTLNRGRYAASLRLDPSATLELSLTRDGVVTRFQGKLPGSSSTTGAAQTAVAH